MDGMLGGMFSCASALDILGRNGIDANLQSAAATDVPASNQENL